jgi:dihydrofolate synthase/folylpolyglutamate synthase
LNNSPQEFLYSLIDYEQTVGYDYDLDSYKVFLDLLGAPHKQLTNVILVGGTKGKGSTAAIINACLISGGYRVGLYSSPHLNRLNERIRVNNRSITDAEIDTYLAKIKPQISTKRGARSFFEALTTIALMYFLERKMDFTILEVGLGGRLDATNASNPSISVITRIGYDHTNLLGTTLSQITNEKAGIIRENGRLITIHQRTDAEKIIKRVAKERNSIIIFADEQNRIRVNNMSLTGSHVSITGRIGDMSVFLPLAGGHQIENLSIALAVLFEMKAMGFYLDLETIMRGIANTQLRGRFNIISQTPLVIFDCAHNEDSFRALDNNLRAFCIDDFNVIFGTNKDKDISYCLKHIFPKARQVFLVKSDNPRALDPEELLTQAKKHQSRVAISASVREALKSASANEAKATLVTGSFYLWQKDWRV